MSNADRSDTLMNRFTDRDRLYRIALYVVMYGIAVVFFIPYWRMFQLSVTPLSVLSEGGFFWIPPELTFAVWQRFLFREPIIYRWAFNTLLIASITTFLVLVIDSMIAYSITRLDWPGQSLVLGIIMASFMIPGYVNIIPLYTVINDLGLLNSYWAIILPFAAGPLGVFFDRIRSSMSFGSDCSFFSTSGCNRTVTIADYSSSHSSDSFRASTRSAVSASSSGATSAHHPTALAPSFFLLTSPLSAICSSRLRIPSEVICFPNLRNPSATSGAVRTGSSS